VYDVTNETSFDHISEWTAEADRHAVALQKMLIGNKTDLIDDKKVETKQAQELADKMHCLFCETSAKTDTNVHPAFKALVNALVQKRDRMPKPTAPKGGESVDPTQSHTVAAPCCR
jgi:GTPase SAR1 family protein